MAEIDKDMSGTTLQGEVKRMEGVTRRLIKTEKQTEQAAGDWHMLYCISD